MRRRNPYPALAVAALVPALVLGGLWKLADSQVGGAAPTTTAPPVSTPRLLGLNTPLLSVRRAPAVLSADLNVGAFATAAQPYGASLPELSCLSISVNAKPVIDVRPDDQLRPASTVKLLTGAVANTVLGADFRYTTEVRADIGPGGVVNGDLYLVGGGDPVLSEQWWKTTSITKHPPTVITDIAVLADRVKAAGVTSITGAVLGDGSRYDDEWFAPTIPKQVRNQLEALPVSALEVNDTRVDAKIALDDPNKAGARVLARLLKERGIQIGGNSGSGKAPAGLATVATIQSPPFAQILREMLATSDNLTAEMMLKELAVHAKQPGTRTAGIAVVDQTLRTWGLPENSVVMVDGSGLSDENRVTCRALVMILQHGRIDDPVGAGLPAADESGTTLEGIFTGTPAAGKLRAKTGTLTNADGVANKPGSKALAGYYPVQGGGQIEFALVLNGESITNQKMYRQYWEGLARLLSTYPAGPSPAALSPG